MNAYAAALALALATGHSFAQDVSWKPAGQQADYRAEWASNLVQKDGGTVTTMMRLVFEREDAAPNNARFDNQQIGVSIRCAERTYFVIGMAYYMGARLVHRVSLGAVGEYEPIAGTLVERFANQACGR